MRGTIDRSLTSEVQIKGLKISLVGRLNGTDRCKLKHFKYGVLNSKYQISLITQSVLPVMTKWGKIGMRVKHNLSIGSSVRYFRVKNENSKSGILIKWYNIFLARIKSGVQFSYVPIWFEIFLLGLSSI